MRTVLINRESIAKRVFNLRDPDGIRTGVYRLVSTDMGMGALPGGIGVHECTVERIADGPWTLAKIAQYKASNPQ